MNRLKEASTWAGIAAIFQVLKSFVPAEKAIILDGLTAVAGTIAGFVPEKGGQDAAQ